MSVVKAILCSVFIAVVCVIGVAEKTRRTDWVLRFDGIGAVRIGMTINQVSAALGEQYSTPTDKDEQTCFYLEPKRHPDTGIMMLDGRVARVDVFRSEKGPPSTATVKGIRVGDSETRVKEAYGQAVNVSQHHYTDGHYLTLQSGNYALRFETDENKVTSFYAGTLAAISLVEGCS